jgi:hypothetical protein
VTASLKAYLIAGGVALALLAYSGWAAYERGIGAANAVTVAQRHRADSLESVLKGERTQLHTDTVRLFLRLTRVDTVLRRLIDTAIVSRVDTVRVPVTVLVAADSAIRSCRETVAECGQVARTEKLRADALAAENAALRKLTPSGAGNVLRNLVWAVAGAGVYAVVKR